MTVRILTDIFSPLDRTCGLMAKSCNLTAGQKEVKVHNKNMILLYVLG